MKAAAYLFAATAIVGFSASAMAFDNSDRVSISVLDKSAVVQAPADTMEHIDITAAPNHYPVAMKGTVMGREGNNLIIERANGDTFRAKIDEPHDWMSFYARTVAERVPDGSPVTVY